MQYLPPHLVPVYLDTLLRAPGTRFVGHRAYTATAAVMEGRRYARSLTTDVTNNAVATEQFSEMTVALNGRYSRFLATLGRDDVTHINGPAYCYFEVYADGQRVFRSQAIRSRLSPVQTPASGALRAGPQELVLPVVGVGSLRLVTRYASGLSQRARLVNRAAGCVWGNARLLPVPPPRPEALISDAPLRKAVQTAALRLAAQVTGSPKQVRRLPLALGVTPLRVEAGAAGHEEAIRTLVAQQLFTVRRGPSYVFKPLSASNAAALLVAVPVAGSTVRTTPEAVAAIGEGVGADLVLLGSVGRNPKSGIWQVALRLVPTHAKGPAAAGFKPVVVPVAG